MASGVVDGSSATLAGTSVGTGAPVAAGTSGVGVATTAIAVGDSPTTGIAIPPRWTTKANDSPALSTRIRSAAMVAFGSVRDSAPRRRRRVRGPAEVAGAVGVGVAKADELLLAEGLRPRCADGDARLLGARDAGRGNEGPVQVAAQERADRRVQGARDVVRLEHDGTGRDRVGVLRDVQGVGREGRGERRPRRRSAGRHRRRLAHRDPALGLLRRVLRSARIPPGGTGTWPRSGRV